MKNSKICRAAMKKIASSYNEYLKNEKWDGMCDAINSFPRNNLISRDLNSAKILNVVIHRSKIINSYYYPTFGAVLTSFEKRKEAYTSRIIYLELAALLWEEIGQ